MNVFVTVAAIPTDEGRKFGIVTDVSPTPVPGAIAAQAEEVAVGHLYDGRGFRAFDWSAKLPDLIAEADRYVSAEFDRGLEKIMGFPTPWKIDVWERENGWAWEFATGHPFAAASGRCLEATRSPKDAGKATLDLATTVLFKHRLFLFTSAVTVGHRRSVEAAIHSASTYPELLAVLADQRETSDAIFADLRAKVDAEIPALMAEIGAAVAQARAEAGRDALPR